jgi:acetoacetyl-CoA synthetase
MAISSGALRAGPKLPSSAWQFDHPLYILYSSGTTGVPKCIVHGAGGTLLQHLKEHRLHCDVNAGERLFYFTTLGWMMWNWLVSGLAPARPCCSTTARPSSRKGRSCSTMPRPRSMTHFGTSAKYIDAIAKLGLKPKDARTSRQPASDALHRLAAGAPESFDYVYRDQSGRAACRRSPAAPTSSPASCSAIPRPVWRGEIQCKGLGHRGRGVRRGRAVRRRREGRTGVHRGRFPRCRSASGTTRTARSTAPPTSRSTPTSGATATGARSPSTAASSSTGAPTPCSTRAGVRIGTAEIYRQVEQLDEVVESLVIGQDWENDVRVVLFVKLREGQAARRGPGRQAIRKRIRDNTTPRHVPAKVVAGRRHSAHQERQDRRAGGAQRGARPAGEERRGARQPGGAGAVPGPQGTRGFVAAGEFR